MAGKSEEAEPTENEDIRKQDKEMKENMDEYMNSG
jgi:hypothetical protein